MVYATLLSEEGVASQYLVVISPRRLVDSAGWTLSSGTKYTQTFSFGEITALTNDGASETEASTSALSDGSWFYDTDTSVLTIDIGSNPNAADIVATYELYFATFDAHFYRNPLDSTTRVVYFEPLITRSPQVSQSSTDNLFGFLPSLSTSISISNTTQFLQEHVYESSFNDADIKIYHYLDELTVANTKLIISGFCGNVTYQENETTIEIFDNRALFDQEFRHLAGMSFYASGTLSGLDPDFDGRPVRKVYGYVDKFIPVNIDFSADAASTTNNRTWVCLNPHTNLGSITATVPATPACTTTRTYIDDASGIQVGDSVWLDKTIDEYPIVTVVNTTGDNYIEHAALASGACAPADTVTRSFIGSVTIVRNGVAPIVLRYKRDYDEYTDTTNKLAGFTLDDNFEAGFAGSTEPFNGTASSANLEVSDLVYCRVYGNKNTETLSASAFGSDSANVGTLAQGVVVLYSLLKNHVGLAESALDTATFTSLQSSLTDELGFAIPEQVGDDFPRYRDIFTRIFQSLLLKFLIDDDNKYSLAEIGPLGSVGKTIEDDEILLSSFEYRFDYKDIISDVIVEYQPKEVSSKNTAGISYSTVTSSSTLATRLHGVTKQRTFQSLHFIEAQAQTYADRLKYALGDRSGKMRFTTKNRFFDTELNHVVRMTRTRMPGFAYDSATTRNRDGAVIAAVKSLRDIAIELDDQKGIEDNSGSW